MTGLISRLRDRIRRRLMSERPLYYTAQRLERAIDVEEEKIADLLAGLWDEMRKAEADELEED